MIGTISTLVLASALLTWMFLFEVRLARLLDVAEVTCDQADRALGWITHYAAPAIAEAVAEVHAFVPKLSNLVVSHEAVMRLLPDWMRADFPDPDPATDPVLPPTVPTLEAITPEAVTGGERIHDVELASTFAAIENNFRDWRTSLEETAK